VAATGTHASGKVIKIDGSSTVFPITQAVAEEFQIERGGRVTVGVSGTGGGFKKFCRGETAISGASRPIKPTEVEMCKAAGVEFVELPIAYDGIAVVVNKKADWVDHLTVDELKMMWAPEAEDKITKWSQVREGWPDRALQLLGPGVDSGTYDYFTKAIVGVEHSSRGDFAPNEDDNVLVHGVSTDEGALGYFGYAYYAENKDKLKLVPIEDGKAGNGEGPIAPSPESVANGTYQPLSRPIFIYVSSKAMQRPEVRAFVEFYLSQGKALVSEVGYIALPETAHALVRKRFADKTMGSMLEGGSKVGITVEEMLAGE
ncbi:MAG: PstS family phosphate ABC transporter substrate-binding protein, partial [Myxococcales bacterium]|nr:PstS family phosphate ABC transporter substrate-binding protein [Myxococcales bacterium]